MTASGAQLFADPFHNQMGTWLFGYIPYGGGDFGEVAAVAAAVGDGDDGAFAAAWVASGDRLRAEAERVEIAGHRQSASELFLRASAHYASAYHPLFGAPVDPRLLDAYRRQIAAFDRGLSLRAVPVAREEVPFDGAGMPLYFVPAEGREHERRPTIVFVNGYDATVTDVYFASAVAASRRGYHSVIFDGPGQGGMLYEQGTTLRSDFEVVVSAVIDHVIDSPLVDAERIAVSGWSLGGYLAPRAASSDARIAACIADPGQFDLGAGIRAFMTRLGVDGGADASPEDLDQATLDLAMETIRANRGMRWSIEQRGFWANGVSDLRSFIAVTQTFTLEGRADGIRCPILVTRAENDPLAAGAAQFVDEVPGPVTLADFTAAEGAGEHCEMHNRWLLNLRALNWLDEVFA
jgi:alpha-beta hydrolase superfamily lysophospholipase